MLTARCLLCDDVLLVLCALRLQRERQGRDLAEMRQRYAQVDSNWKAATEQARRLQHEVRRKRLPDTRTPWLESFIQLSMIADCCTLAGLHRSRN